MSNLEDEWDNRREAVDPQDVADGHAGMSPAEIVMLLEEGEADEDRVVDLAEVLRAILLLVFQMPQAIRPGGWDYAAAAVEALYREYATVTWARMGVDGSSRRHGAGMIGGRGVWVLKDCSAHVGVALHVLADGIGGRFWLIELTRRFYSLAKLLDENLLEGASLETLGDIFSEGNRKGARARWSARNHVLLKVLTGGANLHARYQKSPEACARMAEAQRGNRNRKGGR